MRSHDGSDSNLGDSHDYGDGVVTIECPSCYEKYRLERGHPSFICLPCMKRYVIDWSKVEGNVMSVPLSMTEDELDRVIMTEDELDRMIVRWSAEITEWRGVWGSFNAD